MKPNAKKPKAKKAAEFQNPMVKAVFYHGEPNKEKAEALRKWQEVYTNEANRLIMRLSGDDCLRPLLCGSSSDHDMRKLEKKERLKGFPATWGQSAFDEAFAKMKLRMDSIYGDISTVLDTCLASSRMLLALSLSRATKEQMLAELDSAMAAYASNGKAVPSRFHEWKDALAAMGGDEFKNTVNEINCLYQCVADGYRIPHIEKAHVRLVSTNSQLVLPQGADFAIELPDHVKADAVFRISLPDTKGYTEIPLHTSRNSTRRLKQYGACHSAEYTVDGNGHLTVTIAFKKHLAKQDATNYNGVDVGISDTLHSRKDGAIGSLGEVISFYKKEVEPLFGEISSLRNKKRNLVNFLHRHDLPKDAKKQVRDKIDRLDAMIHRARKAYRRKNRYYAQLKKAIKDTIAAYIEKLNGDKKLVTVLELLDIREFNKSRKENGRYSMFARGLLSKTLMETLNWHGYQFMQVEPAYTSQTCPVCGLVDKASRNGKYFQCTCCGHQDDADHVGSINIEARATDMEMQQLCDGIRKKELRMAAIKGLQKERHEAWLKIQMPNMAVA